ncbi:hypothetical protein KKC32_00260, partial [Patescibacteria group bacterium]|nr:hypothetical protein [Patescibacteria group bacterium]
GASADANESIAAEFGFSVGQLAKMLRLVKDLFFKEKNISDIDLLLIEYGIATKENAREIALRVCGKRLLVVDNEWFNGETAKKILALGGNPADYSAFVAEFKKKNEQEKKEAEAEQKRIEEEDKAFEEEMKKKQAKEKKEVEPLVIKDPEAEKASAKKVFSGQIKDILLMDNFEAKLDIDARLFVLLTADGSGQFQKELLESMYRNNELLTKEKIVIKDEKLDPTIGNWLKDYINFVGVEEAVSTIKKAHYVTNSENVRRLSPDESKSLDLLLDLYVSLKNFYFNIKKYNFEDVHIFPLSDKEKESMKKALAVESAPEEEESKEGGAKVKKPVDIVEMFEGDPEERKQIEAEKEKITETTRKEIDKVGDELEDYLLGRKKFGIIACIEILAETGALDSLLAQDRRYQKFLFGYFDRHNLSEEKNLFQQDPMQEKYLRYFLKYLFLERLGLPESEGARLALRISTIFRDKGAVQYGGLAYLDLTDNSFKWSE